MIVLVALMAGPAVAGASTDYWVEACGPSAVDDFSFFSSDSANLGGSDSACGASNPVGLSVSDLTSGIEESSGTRAVWAVSAPTGETIQSLFYTGGSFATSGGGWIAGWQGDNGNGLTPALDPDAGHDCGSPNTICNTSNAESPAFGPDVGVGPLTRLGLAIACQNPLCPTGGNSATVAETQIELVDPSDAPNVDGTVFNTNLNDGYASAVSHVTLSYAAYDPGGVCALEAELVNSLGAPIASTKQGTVTPAKDPQTLAFTSTLPCGWRTPTQAT